MSSGKGGERGGAARHSGVAAKVGWQRKRLGEVCVVDKCQGIHKHLPYVGLEHIESHTGRFIGSTEPLAVRSSTFTFSPEHILYGRLRPYLNKVIAPDFEGHCSTEIFPIKPNAGLSREFLQYWFLQDETVAEIDATCTGARMPRANMNAVLGFEFLLPPLAEQRRIVGILDEAFAGIATAKANAEKNLQNARELFESHLQAVFAKRGDGWVEKSIAECFKVRSGDFLPAKAMIADGDYDVYGGNGKTGRHNKKNLSGENIIIGRVGAKCGNVRHVKGDLWLTDNAFFISEYFQDFDLGFLTRVLDRKQLRRTANQAAQPVISYTTIKDVMLEFPISTADQKVIADILDAFEAETQHLESVYQRKLAALDELKKSLLHQAFSGDL